MTDITLLSQQLDRLIQALNEIRESIDDAAAAAGTASD